ncbi:hypothetical protein F5Y15DRAFT_361504 [Xylariaceae sp. FL0016]|nr:hypothetical protein F5Y15DRAFT_361504 [Xylariaceae sp. FL0016]
MMARPRKRKFAKPGEHASLGEPPKKKGKLASSETAHPANSQAQHFVLNQFYSRVLTLRAYVVSKLPASSRLRRRKVTAVGVVGKCPGTPPTTEDSSLGVLLDTTFVAIPEVHEEDVVKHVEGWRDFSQRGDESYVTLSNGFAGFVESQCLIVEYVVRTLFSREKTSRWPKHLLCNGFRRNGGLGIRAVRPNPHVESLQQSPWPQLLALLGESGDRIMIDLLLDCSIFVSVGAGINNIYQISGKPLSDVHARHLGVTVQERQSSESKSPSELIFVRNRMLYARAALSARGSVQFGLRHIRGSLLRLPPL